jgi:hypothetical protein
MPIYSPSKKQKNCPKFPFLIKLTCQSWHFLLKMDDLPKYVNFNLVNIFNFLIFQNGIESSHKPSYIPTNPPLKSSLQL